MKSIARYTIAFTRVFTLVLVLASSGFTTILHFCAMEAFECCDTSGSSIYKTCHNRQVSAPVAGMSIQNVNDCRNAVVGGLAVVEAMVEKNSRVQNLEIHSVLTFTVVSPAPSNTSSCCFRYSYNESVSPPSVEKYVLNESLLI